MIDLEKSTRLNSISQDGKLKTRSQRPILQVVPVPRGQANQDPSSYRLRGTGMTCDDLVFRCVKFHSIEYYFNLVGFSRSMRQRGPGSSSRLSCVAGCLRVASRMRARNVVASAANRVRRRIESSTVCSSERMEKP